MRYCKSLVLLPLFALLSLPLVGGLLRPVGQEYGTCLAMTSHNIGEAPRLLIFQIAVRRSTGRLDFVLTLEAVGIQRQEQNVS